MTSIIEVNKMPPEVIKKIPKAKKRVRILTGSHLDQLQNQCCDDCVLFYSKTEDAHYTREGHGVVACFGDICRSPDSTFDLQFDFNYAIEETIEGQPEQVDLLPDLETEPNFAIISINESGADMIINVNKNKPEQPAFLNSKISPDVTNQAKNTPLQVENVELHFDEQVLEVREPTFEENFPRGILEELSRCGKTIDDSILTPDSTILEDYQIPTPKPLLSKRTKIFNKLDKFDKLPDYGHENYTISYLKQAYATKKASPPILKVEKRAELRLNNNLYDKEIPLLVNSMKQGYKEIAIKKKILRQSNSQSINQQNHHNKSNTSFSNLLSSLQSNDHIDYSGVETTEKELEESLQQYDHVLSQGQSNESGSNDGATAKWDRSTKIRYPILCDPNRLIILD